MPGSYLRTNYRATGKEVDIDTLGRAIGLASAAAGAGTIRPGGGLLFFSQALSFSAGGQFADSAIGTLSLFYGSGNFGSGHLFYPIYIRTLSYSTVANTDWVTNNSAPDFLPVNFATSDSVWMISAMKVSATGSATVASQVAARLLVLGFVVSTP